MPEPIQPATASISKASLTLCDDGEIQKLSNDGLNMPSSVFGVPASYGWKDVISPGNWQCPTRFDNGSWGIGELNTTPDRIQHWADTGNQRLSAGVDIPIVADHSEKSGDSRGNVKAFRVKDGELQCLCQLIGEDAKLEAARNKVSIGRADVDTDGTGKTWHDVITHVALTPRPIVTNQEVFKQAASATRTTNMGDTMLPCSETHMAKLHEMVPGLAGIDAKDKIGHIVSHLCTMGAMDDADAGDGMSKMSRAEIITTAAKNRKAWKDDLAATKNQLTNAQQQLSTATAQYQTLSATVPTALPAEAVSALRDSASVLLDNAVEKAAISPAVRDAIFSAMAGTSEKPNYQCLSKAGGGEAPILSVAKALNQNPARMGTDGRPLTGVQTLSNARRDGASTEKKPLPFMAEAPAKEFQRTM